MVEAFIVECCSIMIREQWLQFWESYGRCLASLRPNRLLRRCFSLLGKNECLSDSDCPRLRFARNGSQPIKDGVTCTYNTSFSSCIYSDGANHCVPGKHLAVRVQVLRKRVPAILLFSACEASGSHAIPTIRLPDSYGIPAIRFLWLTGSIGADSMLHCISASLVPVVQVGG